MFFMRGLVAWMPLLLGLLLAPPLAAQTPESPESGNETLPEPKPEAPPALKLGAYVETFFQWNFNRPSNRITNYRGFDNRHDSFSLANVALDAQWDYHDVIGRVTLQVGHTPSTYYLNEPREQGTPGADATGPQLWKYLQQAYLGYRIAQVVTLSAGLYLSPIGPETMIIHENWNWSRSDLFFGCPFYHTGARAEYAFSQEWTFTLAAYNGWNSVNDNNNHKSLSLQAKYTAPTLVASVLYFGGVERPSGSAAGQPWRSLFDTYAQWVVNPWLSLMGQVNAGWEDNNFGASRWAASALYARFRLLKPLFLVTRGDFFRESTPRNASGRATPIFWPAQWVSSATATLDLRANDYFALMLEYRHDQAQAAMYFGGDVLEEPLTKAFIPNRRAQNTLTIGATAWY